MIAVMALGAVLGALLAAFAVVFMGVSLMGGLVIYLLVSLAVTGAGIYALLKREERAGDGFQPEHI